MSSKNTLIEIAWEVCNQVGGIYTVIRSKVPAMMQGVDGDYLLVGPYFNNHEFESIEDADDEYFEVVQKMRSMGYEVHYGYWLVTGKPKVVLINPKSAFDQLGAVQYELWEHHDISSPGGDDLLNDVIAFGFLSKVFLAELALLRDEVKVHIHEWMAGVSIPLLRKDQVPVRVVFTTHATLLGRYLAMNDPNFYDHIHTFDWIKEATYFNIDAQVRIERAAAHGADIFTTVSEVTAKECIHLLGRQPEIILPNGLNVERFSFLHEFQSLHKEYKEKIHEFVMGHFFPSYNFDLDKTIYFFTSGRFEYTNKGYDLTLEALARLNYRLQQEGSDITVVMFFITKQPYHSINVGAMESRALMEELRETCQAIQKQVGERLFFTAANSESDLLPALDSFVDEYWRFRYRRTIQSWKSDALPPVVTHNLVDDDKDPILGFLRNSNMVNNRHDKVKIVYHPDFIASTNPLFHIDYTQFVRGCHLGIFPSYYEPWGYTPLECVVRGVPAVTSDLSGFGDYVFKHLPNADEKGLYVVNRKNKSFEESAEQLTDQMYHFVKQNRRERIKQRNSVETMADEFDWGKLVEFYLKAYRMIK
ncbi:MAG: glycosyltransferase [Cytophagales bacterium]|nr:glycosyltransferase [Cytophagales bacterium]